MAKTINLERSEQLQIEAYDMIITLTLEDIRERIVAQIESKTGGQKLRIGQHEQLANAIYFEYEKQQGLHIVE